MMNVFMLILSTVTAGLLGGTLYVFFVHLHRIEDDFWGRERRSVADAEPDAPATDPATAPDDGGSRP